MFESVGRECRTRADLGTPRPAWGRTGDQFTVSVKVVEAVILEFTLSVPVTVMVYVPGAVAALVTVTVAVPVAELKLPSPEYVAVNVSVPTAREFAGMVMVALPPESVGLDEE